MLLPLVDNAAEGTISREFFTIKHESGFREPLRDGDYLLIGHRVGDVSAVASRVSDWNLKLFNMKREDEYIE